MQTYPPTLTFEFMGASQPLNPGYGGVPRIDHFQTYRNEKISRMIAPHYDWGSMSSIYTPSPDVSVYKQAQKYLKLPHSEFSMINRERQQEVDNFYLACQMHRDQYRDQSNSLHPLDFFKRADYMYQCPTDPTTQYLKCPEKYVKYKQPIVLPLTQERSLKMPYLPDRALTGIYDRCSDIKYKK